jgi:hypothetical protein
MHASHTSGVAGRPLAALLGLFCAGIGLLAIATTVREYNADRRAHGTWVPTRCLIEDATVRAVLSARSQQPIDVPAIRYTYQFRGRAYTSDKIDLRSIDGMHGSWDRDDVAFVRSYQKGQTTNCWVNPEKPDQAVLAIDLPIASYAILPGVGCLFVIVGTALLISRLTSSPISKWHLRKSEPKKPSVAVKRELPVYSPDDFSIDRTPLGVYFRFPRRRSQTWSKFTGVVFGGAILLAIGYGIITFGQFLGHHQTPPSFGSTIFLLTVFGSLGLLCAVGSFLMVMHGFLSTFSHSEVVLRGGRIYGGERVGWLWLGRSLALHEPMKLVIYRNGARPQSPSRSRPIQLHGVTAKRYHDEGLAILDIKAASEQRVTLAQGYPTETLLSWARQIGSAIDQAHGTQPIVSAIGLYISRSDRPDPRTLRPAVTRILHEETAELLRVVLPRENFSIRHVPWIVVLAVVSLIWHGGIGWSNSAIEAVIGVAVALAPVIAFLLYRIYPRQMTIEVRKSNGELAVTCVNRTGESRRTWPAQQRPCVMVSRTTSGGSRRGGQTTYPPFLKVSAVGVRDYSLGGAALTSQERVWCSTLITDALRTARDSNAKPAKIPRP